MKLSKYTSTRSRIRYKVQNFSSKQNIPFTYFLLLLMHGGTGVDRQLNFKGYISLILLDPNLQVKGKLFQYFEGQ